MPIVFRDFDDADRWEESGDLGNDPLHVRVCRDGGREVDEACGLEPVTIRLPKTLLLDLQELADMEAIGLRALVRRLLLEGVAPIGGTRRS